MAFVAGLSAMPSVSSAQEVGGLQPGEAFVTRFSGTTTVSTAGGPQTVIDLAGTSGVALDLRAPGFAADGRHWLPEPHLFSVTAGDVGQVFGVALDDANPPNLYLTATSAFGLHRNADNSGWLDGMWGPGGGPGTIYRLTAANGYQPEAFAEVMLDGRANSGAALGNIAFDRRHQQFFVSDLETGMIHRLALDGHDLGHFDHGVSGRAHFVDAASGAAMSLPAVAFDPATSARTADCPAGDFARSPSCWNFADFRRRVFGLAVRGDSGPGTGEVRLYYAVWGSQAYGNPDWAGAGDDQQNSVWSIAIGEDGDFDAGSVRREFLLPEFFRSPEALARAGMSNPVADIAFPAFGDQATMLVAERGGFRNLGLAAEEPFAYPREARVLRYELDPSGVWQASGRYDVGFQDRQSDGPPYVRAGAAGGAAFGTGYDASGAIDPARVDQFVWMTGDGLCSPNGPCLDPATGVHSDSSEVSGLQGEDQGAYQGVTPDEAFQPYPAAGPATPSAGPDQSYMIDVDINVDASGAALPDELSRNDATRIGDVAMVQQAAAAVAVETPPTLDLSVAKRALAPSCEAGAICPFEIVVTNSGGVPYSGPLVLIDTAAMGATLAGPASAGWSCHEVAPGLAQCSLGTAMLAPGESTSFQLALTIPGSWGGPVFENCVELTTPGAGQDSIPYNNSACGYAPTSGPGTATYAPDLRLTKFALHGQCDPADNCQFVVRITNVGAAPYTGALSFHDQIHFTGAVLSAWAPAPEWTCGPPGGGGFDCLHGPVTLAPGEFREVTLWLAAPPPTPGHTVVENCAWIDWGGSPGDVNPANEYDCASMSRFPSGFPGATALLEIKKTTWSSICYAGGGPTGGWQCIYALTITNTGGAPYLGPFEITDSVTFSPVPFDLAEIEAPWTCVPGVGAATPQTCSRPPVPGGLLPGEHTTFFMQMEVTPTAPDGSWQRNCASIQRDANGDGILETQESCALAFMCGIGSPACPHDVAISKLSQPDPCFPGFPCMFEVAIDNISSDVFAAPVVISDIPDLGAGPPIVTWPLGAACAPAAGHFDCTLPFGLGPNASTWMDIEFNIPADHPGPSFTNCARIAPGPGNVIPDNDEDCAIAFVPFPDLAPWSPSTCQRGTACTLDVQIDNKGLLPFKGRAGVKGTLAPPVTITSITSQTAGLSCSVTGNGAYECLSGGPLDIPAGGAARFRLVVDIPADFGPDAITHTKDMVWPDRAVKDKRPENDRHVSTITITGPKEEQPPPPPPGAGPDLSVTKAADQRSCVAGQACGFTVTVKNVGKGAYVGPIVVDDILTPAGAKLTSAGPSPWSCRGSGAKLTCTHPSTSLLSGAAKTLRLAFTTSVRATGSLGDCAELSWTDASRVFPVQIALGETGFAKWSPTNPPDGKLGPRTREAIEAYQKAVGLPVTGRIDNALLTRLFGTWGEGDVNAGNDRACASAALQPPPATLTCTGGTVRNNQCVCPAGTELRQTGTNAFRCATLPPSIICTGGRISAAACLCPKGAERVQTGPNAFRCVTPPPATITCTGGRITANTCLCPTGTERVQTGTNTFRCVESTSTITCTGGRISNNACVCPKGTERVQTGTNTFRCVPPPPATITCSGGTVREGACVCPKGTERVQVATNAFRCVERQAEITCRGGTVSNNQCICPPGTVVRQTGTNAFRCAEVTPQIICEGGKVRNGNCVCPKGTTPQATGRNAFKCVRIGSTGDSNVGPLIIIPAAPLSTGAHPITCKGGTVSNGACICPAGSRPRQVGASDFRCVKS